MLNARLRLTAIAVLVALATGACRGTEDVAPEGGAATAVAEPAAQPAESPPEAPDVPPAPPVPTTGAVHVLVRDFAGAPYAGAPVVVSIARSAHSTDAFSTDVAGPAFEHSGLRLDAPCEITVAAAGLRWKLAVPTGTRDVVLTAGEDGLQAVAFAGAARAALPAEAKLVCAGRDSHTPSRIRLVHAVTGAVVVPVPPRAFERHTMFDPDEPTFRIEELPVGPWRVELQDGADDTWLPCRPRDERGRQVLVRTR